jgi:glyoxylase-like metal-dependent hydrolase (beta-lactamase superfamily II)
MTKKFASQADLAPKTITFEQLSPHTWAYTAEGDPNCGVVITDDGVLIVDATATPVMARDLIERIRRVTDQPIKYVVLSHYHAVRVLGASAFNAQEIIASRGTYELIVERGDADWKSEFERFPRLFANAESIPGLTWPTMVFERELTLHMGGVEIKVMHLGGGHTKGDTVVWLPGERALLSGDLVEYNAGVYTGDAQLAEWPGTLERLRLLGAEKLVPGRGPAMKSAEEVSKALDYTRDFVTILYRTAQDSVARGHDLKQAYDAIRAKLDPIYGQVFIYEHCIPFDATRAFDEAGGLVHPRIWTAERDQEMWATLQD